MLGVNDADLVRGLGRDQGEDAARALYRSYGRELYGFALSRLHDAHLAEELVQDVFTRVWRYADRFDPDRASFRTWLYGIARNAMIDMDRRRAVRPPLAGHEPPEREGTPEPFEQTVLRWQVQAALARLAPEHRQVITLAHFEGLTLREIAERTGLPLGTVKSRTFYALRNLRLTLEEMEVST